MSCSWSEGVSVPWNFSHLSFVNSVSNNMNKNKFIFFWFYASKFDENSFKSTQKGTSSS